jgi:hypothetical protein
MGGGALDLVGLDREVARAHEAVVRFHAALRNKIHDPGWSPADPLASFRHVAGRNAYEVVAAYPAGLSEEPIKAGLLSWIHALTDVRVGIDLDVSWQREAHTRRGRVLLESPRETSYEEAWRGVVFARDFATRQLWLDAAAEQAPRLAPLARDAAVPRVEVRKRLGLERSAGDGTGEISLADLEMAARGFLRKTVDLRAALRRESEVYRAAETPHSRLAAWIGDALSTDAPEGWPARLTPRWFEEAFRAVSRGARLTLDLPEVVGASSFARGLYGFGVGIREGARSGLPFCVAMSPDRTDAHRIGFVFGALPVEETFQRKVLGLGERRAKGQARSLARTALAEAVGVVARWLLTRDSESRRGSEWEEITCDVFHGPIDARFAGTWPARRGNETSRLEALLEALPLASDLVSRFDVDWYRNPKAGDWMRARSGGPARVPSATRPDAMALASSLSKAFEEALG